MEMDLEETKTEKPEEGTVNDEGDTSSRNL